MGSMLAATSKRIFGDFAIAKSARQRKSMGAELQFDLLRLKGDAIEMRSSQTHMIRSEPNGKKRMQRLLIPVSTKNVPIQRN